VRHATTFLKIKRREEEEEVKEEEEEKEEREGGAPALRRGVAVRGALFESCC
jgi:hypothetical protein